ncbi:MAG TPA: DUF2752 domain-containing protein [Cyclobacteriaceae bacterium]|jgi:hypothetical protein|nr:DUF2752 domain-containing protein [Cyclobacteriaceae bacterium]
MKPNQLYLLFTTLILAGYGWVGFHLFQPEPKLQENTIVGTCVFKSVTGISCPACGTTRSVVHLAHGDVEQAALINPFGFLAFLFLILIPFWLIYDLTFKQHSLYSAYVRTEKTIKTKAWVYIPLIMIVMINWLWNISKNN